MGKILSTSISFCVKQCLPVLNFFTQSISNGNHTSDKPVCCSGRVSFCRNSYHLFFYLDIVRRGEAF